MGIKRAFRKIWSFQERNLKDGIAKGEKMAYYSSPKSTRWQQVRLLQHIVLVYIEQEV